MRFLPIVTQIFLWYAIFGAISASNTTVGEVTIRGYSYEDFVAYYLLTMLGRASSSMPGLASSIALQVREWRDQEVPGATDRPGGIPAAEPHGT